MTTKKADKPKFRIIGIDFGPKLETFGKKFEKAMNDLHKQGYHVHYEDNAQGTVVFGHLPDGLEEGSEHAGATPMLGGKTRAILDIVGQLSQGTPAAETVRRVRAAGPGILAKFQAVDVEHAAKEVEAFAKKHSEQHQGGPCDFTEHLQTLATSLRDVLRLTLQ